MIGGGPVNGPGDAAGTALSQSSLHIITRISPRSVLYLTNDIVRIESNKPVPNIWVRFWHRALLGWRWERLP